MKKTKNLYKNKIISNKISEEKKSKSFFDKERKLFKNVSMISLVITSLINLFFALVIILPFWNINFLIKNVPYFGWPIYALLFLLIWFPGLFIAFNFKAKQRFTDYQLILESRSIWKSSILLAIPSLGTSLIVLILKSKLIKSNEFMEFQKERRKKLEYQIWLSDERPMKTSESATLGAAWLIVILWSLIILFPVYKLLKQTFNGNLFLKLGPTDDYSFSFKHFSRLFENYQYWDWMINSLFISVITMIVVVVLSAFAGFIYSRYRFKSKKASLLLVMTLGIVPSAAALAAYYVLSVILNQGLGLNGKWLLIFLYAGGGTVGNIFVLKGYLDNISTELDDAALIDGCSKFKLFVKVIFPLMRPMLAITAIGAFTGPFGDFILPALLFTNPEDYTLAQGLQTIASGNSGDETAFAAGALIIAIPITTIIMVSQTWLTKGSAKGGVKG